MLKKILLTCLALLLSLSMSLQAVPALAAGGGSDAAADFQPVVLARISSAVMLKGFPPRIRVTGTLPAGCYNLKVSSLSAMQIGPDTDVQKLIFVLKGVWQRGAVCTQTRKPFTTTVTIDPLKMNLSPGHYLVLFNPVNGQSRFKFNITIPSGLDDETAVITEAFLQESNPPQLQVTGTLSAPCYQPKVDAPRVAGSRITIQVHGTKPAGLTCATGDLQTFRRAVKLDPAPLGLAPGKYTVLVNPVNGQSAIQVSLIVP